MLVSFFDNLSGKELLLTRRINFSRFATIVSFSVGSVISVLFDKHYEYIALAVPFATSVIVYFSIRTIGHKLDGNVLKSKTRDQTLNAS